MNKALTTVKLYKLIILIICFALTSIFIYQTPASKTVKKQVMLTQALSDIKGWAMRGYTPLDPRIVKSLELDDYVNHNYSNGYDTIALYIGYYFTTKKVGAAHDPLVCFPGQGWVVSDTQKDKIVLNPKPRGSISYSSMMVQRGSQKELIIYWFQSYDQTNPDTFSQKITSLYQKIFRHREDNAFVRVSTPIEERSLSECHEAIFKFIRSFYPVFLNYVKQGRTLDEISKIHG
jgi:EpsI family protein